MSAPERIHPVCLREKWVQINAERVVAKGAVYLIRGIQSENVKIGHSFDPYARLQTLQTANPETLELADWFPASRKVEAELHSIFDDLRIRGEWFYDQDGEISEAFRSLKDKFMGVDAT